MAAFDGQVGETADLDDRFFRLSQVSEAGSPAGE